MAMTALLNQRVWRFSVGDTVWIRGWAEPAKVTTLAAWRARSGFPHYVVVDSVGAEWIVSQLEVSSKAIAP